MILLLIVCLLVLFDFLVAVDWFTCLMGFVVRCVVCCFGMLGVYFVTSCLFCLSWLFAIAFGLFRVYGCVLVVICWLGLPVGLVWELLVVGWVYGCAD